MYILVKIRETDTDRKTDRHMYTQTDRQTDRQIERQRDMQVDQRLQTARHQLTCKIIVVEFEGNYFRNRWLRRQICRQIDTHISTRMHGRQTKEMILTFKQ